MDCIPTVEDGWQRDGNTISTYKHQHLQMTQTKTIVYAVIITWARYQFLRSFHCSPLYSKIS